MKCTKIDKKFQNLLVQMMQNYPLVNPIIEAIHAKNGRAYLVGGAVRDMLLGIDVKDIDIEVHCMSADDLEKLLATFGVVTLVGKVFGVFRLHGLDVDWSLPRSDSPGRKPNVTVDPHLGIESALRRRDLTMNAMAIDLSNYELIDPFGGLDDMNAKVLRTPDTSFFIEDPLRFYRVMQFIARFDMQPDDQLNTLCSQMSLAGVSKERISDEFEKMFLKSCRPSLGIRWLHSIKRLAEILPEVAALVGVQQDPQWHPEGGVFEHTMQTIDAAARFSYDDQSSKLIFLFAALGHDLGKALTTELIDGRIRSLGHAQASVPLAKKLLKRITIKKDLVAPVCTLIRYHMHVLLFVKEGAKASAYKRLAKKLAPYISLEQLAQFALADRRGRNPSSRKPLECDDPEIRDFILNAQKAMVNERPEEPLLRGSDLMGIVPPGPLMGKMLKRAYDIQLEQGIKEKQDLLERVLIEIKK